MDKKKKSSGLWERRELLLPTWRGWLVLVVIFLTAVLIAVREIHPFLAVNDPLPGGSLVVEGWAPDDALRDVMAEFKRDHYDRIYVVGGPLESGAPLSEYKTYAELGAAVLLKLGLTTNEVQAVPAPKVRQDRTYTSAVALRNWLRQHGITEVKFHLMSGGPHARRSRLMFKKAFGKGVAVGVTSLPPREYDPRHWWRYSTGVRGVVDEAVAYVYARVLFSPQTE